MADDKTKRGSPDSKRLNKSEPYEMAYARKKARDARSGGATKKAAKKASGSAKKTGASRTAPARKSSPPRTAAKRTSAKSPARRRMTMDGTTPPPASREKRERGAEKSVTNTAPAMKREPDAVDLLVDDHLAAYACFKKYEKLAESDASADDRRMLAQTVCKMIAAHAQIEEEIFYPAARKAGVEEDLMDEADVEHASAKELIAQIESGDPDDDKYDAKVTVLGEYIAHHVKEEHSEMFSKCRKSSMDLAGLRVQMEARKAELGPPEPPDDGEVKRGAPKGGTKGEGLLSRMSGGLIGS